MSNTPKRPLSLKRDANPAESSKLEERLHKVLAQAGLGSRRALEQRIADGMVKVNGEVARTGMSVKSGDKVELDGRSFVASALTEPARVLMYNKPEGEVTTREDPEGRPTIFEALPVLKGARWIAIGRLDINTTGLLLLTTDGELANAMMHPSREVEREYVCRVRPPEGESEVSDKIVDRLRRGVALEDGPAKFDAIERIGGNEDGSHDWFRVLLKEGRNREVRRLWESQGCQVSRLKRSRYGSVELPAPLLRGQAQELSAERVETLRREFDLEQGPPPALTLQPVVGQRRASKSTVHVGSERRQQGYVNGHNAADEGRELRRFDHVREDRGRRGPRKPHGGLTVSGEQAAKQSQKPFKQRKDKHSRALPEGNPAAFRSWYVPDGVDTGPSGHRNAGERGPKKRFGGNKPQQRGPGGGGFGGEQQRGQRREGPRHEGNFGGGEGRPQRQAKPYGHPGNAPSFPSDHAHGGGFNPYGTHGDQKRPRGPRPDGQRPGGQRPGAPRPGGNRPFNAASPPGARPRGPRPGGNRGPRGGGNHGGQR
ncbi:rRNA pseudouridine synthase [Pseudoluteimonas lycopersici]|uniref:Pseudouridine synthase n=1 Tax=Pseudoluteimonas lycopersici TaxID=1324796 RepID=A0A516V2N3_9GAMM|nr:pseudouridine synthase [Lysobacter lycopersici]QDQ72774.1 rRNA pseudouridine synthase [Lysobacter lycopersici]